MPKFKHGDKVVVLPESSNPYAGKTGAVWGSHNLLGVDSQILYYLVDFEDVADDVRIMESDLALVSE